LFAIGHASSPFAALSAVKVLGENTNTMVVIESNFDQLTPEQLRAGKMPGGKS
jgi:hypothetical protein